MVRINSKRIVWFESPDNCGKTTLVKALRERLESENITTSTTNQPASTPFGEAIYNLHHQYEDLRITGLSRQLCHVAAHLQHYTDNSVNTSRVELHDRSFISSMAYHYAFSDKTSSSLSQELRWIFDIETKMLPKSMTPHFIVYLTNPPFKVDNEKWESFKNVKEGYLEIFGDEIFQEWRDNNRIEVCSLFNEDLDKSVDFLLNLISGNYTKPR